MEEKKKGLLTGFGISSILLLLPMLMMSPMLFGLFVFAGLPDETEKTSSKCTPSVSTTDEGKQLVNVPEEYLDALKKASEDSGFPQEILAKQIDAESGWNPNAVSPAGAKGLTQFIPSTWEAIAPGEDPFDPIASIAAQGRYMGQLKGQVEHLANGDANMVVKLSLAAYNAGPGAVFAHGGMPPYSETINYVNKITAGAQMEFTSNCSQVDGARSWDGDLGDGEWTNPCPGCVFTSPYGWRNIFPPGDWRNEHVGIDLATPGAGNGPGTTIIAPVDMEVVGFLPNDGCVTTLQEGGPGFGFNFCHLDSWEVSKGQKLKRGDIIGIEGGTGNGARGYYGTHLHLEIYAPESPVPGIPYNGFNLDPEPILKEKGAWVTQ